MGQVSNGHISLDDAKRRLVLMTEYDADAVKALEDLPKNSLVLINETGEVFRRTAQGAGSRHQWVKLVEDDDEKSYHMFSDEVLAIAHTVIWNPLTTQDALDDGFDEELRVLAKELSKNTWTAPGLAPGIVDIPDLISAVAKTQETSRFTEADYPRIMEAIKQKVEFPLDFDQKLADDEEYPENGWLSLGSITYMDGYENLIPGNLNVGAQYQSGADVEKLARQQIRTIVQPDGGVNVEITYFPLMPYNQSAAIKLFGKSDLRSILTIEEFIKAADVEEPWIRACFGSTDIYELFFEVTTPGAKSILAETQQKLFKDPLWVQHKDQKYTVHVIEHMD